MTGATGNIVESMESATTGFSEQKQLDAVNEETSQKFQKNSDLKDEIDNELSIDRRIPESEVKNNPKTDSNLEKNSEKTVGNHETPASTVKKKYRNFLDSDSEEDENRIVSSAKKSASDRESDDSSKSRSKNVPEKSNSSTVNKKSRRLVDSESDDDTTIVQMNNDDSCDNGDCKDDRLSEKAAVWKPKSRFRTLVDSDSEDERESNDLDTTEKKEERSSVLSEEKKSKKINTIVDSESEYEADNDQASRVEGIKKSVTERKKSAKVKKTKEKSKFNALVDTDSEDDNNDERKNIEESFNEGNINGVPSTTSKKREKKRTGSARAAKDEAMRQIHSETQRLVRSSAVSLPYHRPKQRTLEDFLNRKKLIPVLPEGLTTAAKVKMSTEIVGKVLEEKEKEAELFYKSSDSEDEEPASTPMLPNPIEDSSSTNVDTISIEETQKILKNDLQNAHNKKEIIQQAGLEIGVPRKLFVDLPQDHLEKSSSVETQGSIEDDEDTIVAEPKKKAKEVKHGMREGNAPRKLFPIDFDGVDSPFEENNSPASVPTDTPVSVCHKDGEIDMESIDEGVHSLSKSNDISLSSEGDANDFVLKFTDSELPETVNDRNINGLGDNSVEKPTESLDISETPFISNKEYAKLNERGKSSKQQVGESGESFETPEDLPFGHVYGLPPPDFNEPSSSAKTASKTKKLLPLLSNAGPKLRGSPGMTIDLSDDSRSNKEGVKSLVDRFMRHSSVNKPEERSTPVTVLHTVKTNDEIKVIEEILPYKLPINDVVTDKELQKPGGKHKRLKMNLIDTMVKKRGEEWELKELREKDDNSDGIDNDEEIEELEEKSVDDESDGSTESEPEEDDLKIEKKKKKKHRAFADEEAEVSGEDDEEDEGDEEEDNISLRVENDDEDDTDEISSDGEESNRTENLKTSRIVKAFEDDSNSQPDQSSDSGIDNRRKVLERTKTDVDMFEPENDKDNYWSSDNDNEFPPSQVLRRDHSDARSQLCKTPLTAINVLRFVSPITQLTALNSGNDSPALNDIPLTSSRDSECRADKTPQGASQESPISWENDKRFGFQKKLFQDPAGTVNDEELMDLCSGKFTGAENDERLMPSSSKEVTETQLLALCSGSFASETFDADKYEDKRDGNVDNCSQDKKIASNEISDDSCEDTASNKTKNSEKNSRSLKVASSSEDESSKDLADEGKKKKIFKKKRVQKLDLSDDEDDEEMLNEEEILDKEDDEKYVDYDSEENEVVVVPKKDLKKVAANFLEAEAELSESEWGSEDEDEKDLDRLEFEEGDDEEIDENQMRDQLGKIHMRRVQDDDQREVRMLQELLFEDGDLHTDGSGRERKFKWKNIDQLNNDDDLGPRNTEADEKGDGQEDENELEWRKERVEREKFIEDKLNLSTEELLDESESDSQVFKLGLKALKRCRSSQNSQETEPAIAKPITSRTVLDLVESQSLGQSTRISHKAVSRSSFLARGDEGLARIAVYIKETSETTSLTRKNPKNFVFTHLSPSVMEASEGEKDDATVEDSSENSKAKKRKSTSSITPRSTKKAKLDAACKTGKKLF